MCICLCAYVYKYLLIKFRFCIWKKIWYLFFWVLLILLNRMTSSSMYFLENDIISLFFMAVYIYIPFSLWFTHWWASRLVPYLCYYTLYYSQHQWASISHHCISYILTWIFLCKFPGLEELGSIYSRWSIFSCLRTSMLTSTASHSHQQWINILFSLTSSLVFALTGVGWYLGVAY